MLIAKDTACWIWYKIFGQVRCSLFHSTMRRSASMEYRLANPRPFFLWFCRLSILLVACVIESQLHQACPCPYHWQLHHPCPCPHHWQLHLLCCCPYHWQLHHLCCCPRQISKVQVSERS